MARDRSEDSFCFPRMFGLAGLRVHQCLGAAVAMSSPACRPRHGVLVHILVKQNACRKLLTHDALQPEVCSFSIGRS